VISDRSRSSFCDRAGGAVRLSQVKGEHVATWSAKWKGVRS
jgi:hypothetical protein